MHACPVEALDPCRQLRRRQMHRPAANARPMEATGIERFRKADDIACRRATFLTVTPGARNAATIDAFSSALQRRRGLLPVPASAIAWISCCRIATTRRSHRRRLSGAQLRPERRVLGRRSRSNRLACGCAHRWRRAWRCWSRSSPSCVEKSDRLPARAARDGCAGSGRYPQLCGAHVYVAFRRHQKTETLTGPVSGVLVDQI
jgi:hypothetical protein